MADVSVRPAGPADVDDVARIQVDAWQYGYAAILPATVLELVTVENARPAWAQAITAPPTATHRVLVAQEKERVVGFTALAPAEDVQPDDPDPDTTIQIGPILVEPRWSRRGHGSRLMAAAIEFARSDGMTRAVAWIPEADTVSREFLVGANWAPDGLVRALDTGAGELREIRLHVSLRD
ncbi:MAG TPA: GNAT family N-acetyltransferase [Jatrophihabitans sp.]|jgi:GNAT superfamily N-acetyltransferase